MTPETASGRFSQEGFGATLAALMPENAIVAEEAVTLGRALFAPVACPDRKVICLEADGSGMYSLQSLWTQARENLDVVNVIFANRKYAILQAELAAVGATPGKTANNLLDLGRPNLDWVSLARGMGVEGSRVETLEGFADVFRSAVGRRGPFLIEMVI
jgi:acetolactate synthase-1/2/3 large subunit